MLRIARHLPAGVPRRVAIAAGLLFSGSFQMMLSAPVSWWWFAPVYLVPGLWAITQLSGRSAFLGGWLMGIAANLTIFYWLVHTVHELANLPYVAAAGVWLLFGLLFGLYCAVFAWGFRRVRQISAGAWPFCVAAWWVTCEFLNPQLFPYYQGVSLYQVPSFFLITAITGVSGVSFQIVTWNVLGLWCIERHARGESLRYPPLVRATVVAAALAGLSVVLSLARQDSIATTEAGAEGRVIALVQSNLDVHQRRAMSRRQPSAILETYLRLSREALAARPDIDAFVFPEGALLGAPDGNQNRALREMVHDTGVEVWTGGNTFGTRDGTRAAFNSAFRVFGRGEVDARYDKNILLPFGEFMPLRDVFPAFGRIRGVGNFVPGERLEIYDAPFARFCFLICYEAIQEAYVRDAVRARIDMFVNITYDGWFGDTTCPDQHLMLAAIQSAQYGVPMVRAATTGISAFVDARGVIRDATEVFTPAVLVGEVRRVHVPSIYAAYGDWFAWACTLLAGGLLGGSALYRRNQ